MSTHTNEHDPAVPAPELWTYYGLTAREHAAIHLRVPMSGNPWLNDMITEARRWDAAQAALAWLPHTGCGADLHTDEAALAVSQLATSLTRQMEGGAQ